MQTHRHNGRAERLETVHDNGQPAALLNVLQPGTPIPDLSNSPYDWQSSAATAFYTVGTIQQILDAATRDNQQWRFEADYGKDANGGLDGSCTITVRVKPRPPLRPAGTPQVGADGRPFVPDRDPADAAAFWMPLSPRDGDPVYNAGKIIGSFKANRDLPGDWYIETDKMRMKKADVPLARGSI